MIVIYRLENDDFIGSSIGNILKLHPYSKKGGKDSYIAGMTCIGVAMGKQGMGEDY